MRRTLNGWWVLPVLLAAMPVAAEPADVARVDAINARAEALMLTDPQAAAATARQGEAVALRMPDQRAQRKAIARSLWLQGEAVSRLSDSPEAGALIARARAYVRLGAPGSKLEGDILLTSGTIHGNRTEVAAALADFQRAHNIFSRIKEARSEAIALVCLSTLYKDAKDYDAALRYLSEALDIYRADPKMQFSIYNNRGVILQHEGRIDAAEIEFAAADKVVRTLGSPSYQLALLTNRVRNRLLANKPVAAEIWIRAALNASKRIGEQDGQLQALMAQAALQQGRAKEAGALIDRAFAGVDLTTTTMPYREAHQVAFDTYQALHRDHEALAHLTALKRLDDEATKLATQTSNALMAARFDSANQEARIARLRDAERLRVARDALKQAEFERFASLVAVGGTTAILILLLFNMLTLRRSRDQVRAANDELGLTNAALNKALAAKTEFLATTSHEIRTPLNGILGMTQVMLADAALAPALRDRLDVVKSAGITMRALVDDILDVAKLETGNLTLDATPFDLRATLTEAAAMWREQADAKGLRFALDVSDCPPCVAGDPARVRQIVFNLLSNALKFTAEGGVSVTAAANGQGVQITVSDTGIGIPPDRQGHVFEPFRQADASTTRRFGGTGLGLSICRSLARAMGGEIVLDSEPGRGSTFVVRLPLPTAAAVPAASAGDEATPALLIVDRNPIARAMFRSLFAGHVERVCFAATPEEVAAGVAGGSVVQLLVDDATARWSGDSHAFVAAVVAAAGDLPVTLLWPVAATRERDELMQLGIACIVAKPVSGAALIATLFPPRMPESDSPLVSQAA